MSVLGTRAGNDVLLHVTICISIETTLTRMIQQ